MNIKLLIHVLSGLTIFLGLSLLAPFLLSLYFGDVGISVFLIPALACLLGGGLLFKGTKTKDQMTLREGFAIVTFSWLSFSLIGAIPFYTSGAIPSFVDCFFEAMSGLSTTGSSILTEIESLPQSILFWRSLTQWLGGMGIIVLSIAILPILGIEGTMLFFAESPGPSKDHMNVRIKDTAKALWGIYLCLTVILFLALIAGGMSIFDSLNHALNTLSTGGFSTKNASIGHYESSYIQWIITAFMLLGGINFSLHYACMKGKLNAYFKSEEFRVYMGILFTSITIITFLTYNAELGLEKTLRYAAFQVVSISTTTGYGTYDYEMWPFICQLLLLFLMFVGGSAGSTSGGMKVVRIIYTFKSVINYMSHLIHPKQIKMTKVDHQTVTKEISKGILNFVLINVGVFTVGSLIMAATGLDPLTAMTSVVACLSNIGPGLGSVGPTENFAHISDLGKIVLSLCMLVGRLEYFTVLVLFLPSAWKKN
ncbi:MAG: TrkH family potassium uptake protein [Bacteriovoracaceae bacterium]